MQGLVCSGQKLTVRGPTQCKKLTVRIGHSVMLAQALFWGVPIAQGAQVRAMPAMTSYGQISAPAKPPAMKLVVRNTFLDVVDAEDQAMVMKHSHSDSELSNATSSDRQVSQLLSRKEKYSSSRSSSSKASDEVASSTHVVSLSSALEVAEVDRPHPSDGSAVHSVGICTPCSFSQKDRCVQRDRCGRCHYKHEKVTRHNKKAREKHNMHILQSRNEPEGPEGQGSQSVDPA